MIDFVSILAYSLKPKIGSSSGISSSNRNSLIVAESVALAFDTLEF